MRIINGILAVLLFLFAAVQYNDPDGPLWIGIYGAGAVWCALVAVNAPMLATAAAKAIFGVFFAAAIAGAVWYWPDAERWWDIDVWWPETGEMAREGMGMMIIVACLLVAGIGVMRARRG